MLKRHDAIVDVITFNVKRLQLYSPHDTSRIRQGGDHPKGRGSEEVDH